MRNGKIVQETLDKQEMALKEAWDAIPVEEWHECPDEDSIYEMSNFMKAESGLPVNLWLDTAENYKRGGHWKRIKVQNNYGDKFRNDDLFSITISDNPEIKPPNVKVKISNDDVEIIKNFIKTNKDLLLKLADQEINYTQFLNAKK